MNSMNPRQPLTGRALALASPGAAAAAAAPVPVWLPILCAALYVFLALSHAYQSGATKHRCMLVVVLGCLMGAADNCLQVWAHYLPVSMVEAGAEAEVRAIAVAQQLLLLLPPQLFAAVQYFTFSRTLELFGPEVALLRARPKAILAVLLVLEGLALVLQAVAVGLSADGLTATGEVGTGRGVTGAILLIAGLGMRLLACLLFLCTIVVFLTRTAQLRDPAVEYYSHYTPRLRLFTAVLAVGNLLVTSSCIFRLVQTTMGSSAKLTRVEWYSYAFYELPLLLCVLLLGIFHPGHVLPLEHDGAVTEAGELREALVEGMTPLPPRGISRAASSFHCRAGGRVPQSPLSPTMMWRERAANTGRGVVHSRNVSMPDSNTTIVDVDREGQEMTYVEFLSSEGASKV
ncbi:hypothetical protein BCV69DRAFT_53596 [Microstroma glucosiphilum]|uniref:RTA1-domain-containing protein n=1 Tax=Pseudomicrostroma glucosiphilum TaxID=1684307 RepID=A0A316U0J9_9BASI|nr:hypothetical protein BCV69DRAFT_53596 [Pseudomicrostroma glucosiphilum]PWN18939.1 hypothetical protein BCV69DRAFT_53596 [Pseudomicrostroma glucosiphilum]